MADSERENGPGFVDVRYDNKANTGSLAGTPHSGVNYNDVADLRTRLAAANGAYFTAARLNGMTKNDMVYALRVIDDAAGIR